MAEFPTDKWELLEYRNILMQQRQEALAAGDTEKAENLQLKINLVQKTISKIALEDVSAIVSILEGLRQKLEDLTEDVQDWPFGSREAPVDHERPHRDESLPENDFLDNGPSAPAPAPAPVPAGTIPEVSPDWAQNYTELWGTMQVSSSWNKISRKVAEKIVSNQNRYSKSVHGTNVPWWFIAVVHAMECSLRFDQHLHNGDPLTQRTVNVPKGRPASGSPPFSWEESARDALEHDRLLTVTDWSLANVLYHWHRYNGINNEYKRRGIPTPYLWSGCQHYRKGKYVRDGVFDANAVSKQVGAAVLLKSLIDLGAVALKPAGNIEENSEAASGDVSTIHLPLPEPDFKHVPEELKYPGQLLSGSGGTGASNAEKRQVERVQEWLTLQGFDTGIDGDFGPSTKTQLTRFQTAMGSAPTGELDEESWVRLSNPMRRALAPIEHGEHSSFEEAVVRIARQHTKEIPTEVGGANSGPWVRLYMAGRQGRDQLWCAGFISLIVAQAARDLKQPLPFRRRVGVDALVNDAKSSSRYIRGSSLASGQERRSVLKPGMLFVVRRTSTDWVHVGIIGSVAGDNFDTFEGNTSKDGGRDGIVARKNNRGYNSKDFLKLF